MNIVAENGLNAVDFYGATTPFELLEKFGSPLYVYNEATLRRRCREMRQLVTYPHFIVSYSAKANCNLELLKIIRQEGLHVDAMSPGEIFIQKKAGFEPQQILYIGNNVSKAELQFAVDEKVLVSVDSLSQLKKYGEINPGSEVVVRFNPGVGAGHHQKVITGGKHSKFGVERTHVDEVKRLAKDYRLKIKGIDQHIGSFFLEEAPYLQGVDSMLELAGLFDDLDFVDFGGGFGIALRHEGQSKSLDLRRLGQLLDERLAVWVREYGKEIQFMIEPGRYIVAECGVLLGEVHAIKENYGIKYIGTDLGFNNLIRPVLYDAYHGVEVYRFNKVATEPVEQVKIVGNICESGDIIANDRWLPRIYEDDIIAILDAGAYGYCMSSNYNNRLRPAEVLIDLDGEARLIRRREDLEDLCRLF